MNSSNRLLTSLSFLLAVSAIIFWGFGVWLATSHPYDGIRSLLPDGLVEEFDTTLGNGDLRVGDIILEVDGLPVEIAAQRYAGKDIGDAVSMVVLRQGHRSTVELQLIQAPLTEVMRRLAPLLVMFIFWLVGVTVQAYNSGDHAADLFYLFSQVSSLFLVSGSISSIGPAWVPHLFAITGWLIGPLSVHFHLYFPQQAPFKHRSLLLGILYGMAFLGGLPYLVFSTEIIRSQYAQAGILGQFFLFVNLLIVVFLLVYAYRFTPTAGVRGKIRIVILGGVLGLLPIITLALLPDLLSQKPLIPNHFALLLLSLIPITYGYAIVRHRLISIEKHFNRWATYLLVYSLLIGIYLVTTAFFSRVLPVPLAGNPLFNTVLILFLSVAFSPIRNRVQKIVDEAFYGGWYDFRTAVPQITQGLEKIDDLQTLARTLSTRICVTLRLESAYVYLTELDGSYSVIQTTRRYESLQVQPVVLPVLMGESIFADTLGKAAAPVLTQVLKRSLSEDIIRPEEQVLLDDNHIRLWSAIYSRNKICGLMGLGNKIGGDTFNHEDMDILRTAAQQIGSHVENIHLLARLRQYAASLEKRVEERTAELNAAKERVEAILSSVGEGVIVTDLTGEILTVNQAYMKQSAFGMQEIVGNPLDHLVSEQAGDEIRTALRRVRQTGEVWEGELQALRKDRTRFDAQFTLAPIRNSDGDTVGFVGSQRDITRQKELDHLKDQFILEVSHQLRTPATNLNLFVELLQRGKAEKREEYLAILKAEVQQLSRMIEDVLHLSRLEIGKSKRVEFRPVDINLVVEQVLGAYRHMAEEAGLALTLDTEEDLPMLRGEQNEIARVINNLLSNAVRYTEAGEVKVKIFPDDGGVCLEVQDTGIGIGREDMVHLFDRFYRGRNVSESRHLGSGLGLTIAKEIVELHEGEIHIESEEGKGTRVRVWLPCSIQENYQPEGLDL